MPFETNKLPLHREVKLIRKDRIPTTQIYKIVVSPLILQEHPIVLKKKGGHEYDGQRLKRLKPVEIAMEKGG